MQSMFKNTPGVFDQQQQKSKQKNAALIRQFSSTSDENALKM